MKPTWNSLALLLVALLLFAAGYAVKGERDRAALETQRLRADSALQAVTVQHARARDSLNAISRQSQARADSAERVAFDKRRTAALFKSRADSLTAVLAIQTNAADSLPLVVLQRDQAVAAYDTLAVGYDSLLVAIRSLRTTVAAGDSLARLASTESAAREAALRSLNQSLWLELDRANHRGRFLGLGRISDGVKLLAGAALGYCLTKGCP